MAAKNDSTGDEIKSTDFSEEYKENFDRIFGDPEENRKNKKFKTSEEVKQEELEKKQNLTIRMR